MGGCVGRGERYEGKLREEVQKTAALERAGACQDGRGTSPETLSVLL